MCAPVLPLLALASAAVTATGQVMNGIAQKQQANYAASIADQNAQLSADQARDSIQNTNLEAQRRYREQAQTQGQQQAGMAASGVDLNFGSAARVQEDTAMIGAEDIGQIYKAGYQRTRGFDIQGWNYTNEASMDRAKGRSAMLQGVMGAMGTALGAASQFGKAGGFGGG